MKRLSVLLIVSYMSFGCNQLGKPASQRNNNKELAEIFEKYHEESLQQFPLKATTEGDTRYNDLLPVDFTDSYRSKQKDYFQHFLVILVKIEKEKLSDHNKLSYDIFKYSMDLNIEGLKFPDNYIPFN